MSNTTVTTCGGVFYDSGGVSGNYGNNQNLTMTFCADDPTSAIQFVFTSFNVETNWDFFNVYDGPSALSPLIGSYTGLGLGFSPGTVQSSGSCLTFVFTSDGSLNYSGWSASISCEAAAGCTDPDALNYNNLAQQDDGSCVYDCGVTPLYNETVCYGNNANISLYFPPPAPGFGLDLQFIQGQIESFTFDQISVYDGPSTTSPLLYNNITGSATDLTGLSLSAFAGEGVLITITSDASLSCASGSFLPIIFDIFCTFPQGCTDDEAYNFDPDALEDDGSCIYDCGDGALFSQTLCYGNNENISVYIPNPFLGSEVILNFLQGEVESFTFDQLVIYDGSSSGAPILYQNPNGTVDLQDFTVSSTQGEGLLITLTTDGSVSCESGALTSIIFQVFCGEIGCTNPSSPNYNPNAGFDDGSCLPAFDNSQSGCPDIDLGGDLVLDECFDPCEVTMLSAEFFDTGATSSYEVFQIPYNPYPYDLGTQFSIDVDDVWSASIPLPFNFCFYGQTYSECVVGSNGLVSFNTNFATGYCPWQFVAPCPSPTLPRNAVFGAYHDIDPSVCGTAKYAVAGAAPCRVFVVSFDDICHFSGACNSLRSTTQIVLYETTNVIEVFVQDKPICPSWNGGRAVIGIQNNTGNVGLSAPGRNTGVWSATNEAWRFIPSGESIVEINWYAQGPVLVGTGPELEVCPSTEPQTFVAEAVYSRCDGTSVTVADIATVSCLELFLPVEWLEFEARLINDERQTLCTWATGSETNNTYFAVERSADGLTWEPLGDVPGAGNSTTERHYQFTDPHPLYGQSYYRIRQNDFNGAFKYSDIRSVERKPAQDFSVAPNPGRDRFTLTGYQDGDLVIYDAQGRRIPFTLSLNGELNLHSAARGVYFLELQKAYGATPERLRLIVQ